MESPGDGELSLSACPGVGNRLPSKKKTANPFHLLPFPPPPPPGVFPGGWLQVELNHTKIMQTELKTTQAIEKK